MRAALTRRTFLQGAAATISAAAIGCDATPADEPGKITLTFLNYATPEFLALYKKLIAGFEATHPNIRIRQITSLGDAGYETKLLTMIAGGIPPDVFHVTQANFPLYATKDVCLSLDPFLRADGGEFLSELYAPVVNGMRYNRALLGLPSDLSPIVMLYNQDRFDDYKIPYPREGWTWDEFLETCHRLTRDTDQDGDIDYFALMNFTGTGGEQFRPAYNRWPAWVWMNGGDIFTPNMSRCLMDTPASIGGMQFFADLSLKHHVSPIPGENLGQNGQDLFATRRLGLIAESRYVYKKFMASVNRKGLPFRWDCAPMPRGKELATTFIWGGNCILKSTKHPEECWQFLKYIAGPAGAAINLAGGNALPVHRKSAEAEVLNPTNPATPKHDHYFLDAIGYGRIAPYPAQFAEFGQAADHFDDAWLGRIPVAEACRRFTADVNQALKVEVI
ncbi:MAG TPA: sugar ABC transporter substrate-binding protein [Tepidisphaeraceae bacterium]|nr:sugar ABC transporter substrate-binding protein [Tepidisphaeraceae bacterium]